MRGIDVEWPGLADVSLDLTRVALSEMSPIELGAFVRLAHAIAGQSVNTYSSARSDPSLPDDDKILARVTFCTPGQWRKIKKRVLAEFELCDGCWRLSRDVIRFSRRTARNPIPLAVKSAVLARDGRRCSYCGSLDGPFHFDHLFPVSRGGADIANNIVVACASCNLSKSDRTILEWVAAMGAMR